MLYYLYMYAHLWHLRTYIFRTSSWSVVKLLFIGFLCGIASIYPNRKNYEPTAVTPASTSSTPPTLINFIEQNIIDFQKCFSKEEAKHKQHEKNAHFHHPKITAKQEVKHYVNTISILKRFLIIVRSCYRDNKRSRNLLWWKHKEKNAYNYIALLYTALYIYISVYIITFA